MQAVTKERPLYPTVASLAYPVSRLNFALGTTRVVAGFSGRGEIGADRIDSDQHTYPSRRHVDDLHFSMRRSEPSVGYLNPALKENLAYYAHLMGIRPSRITLPAGAWPHSGRSIIAEQVQWVRDEETGGIVPYQPGMPKFEFIQYDGIVTASPNFNVGIQGADCSTILFYEPSAMVVGGLHGGWKPVVRGGVYNVVRDMTTLGADPAKIQVWILPGAGSDSNEFKLDEMLMEPYVRAVFEEQFLDTGTDRTDLLDGSFTREISDEMADKLAWALGRVPVVRTSFDVNGVAKADMLACGILPKNIIGARGSTLLDERLHSHRRDMGPNPKRPQDGRGIATISLNPIV